MSNDLPEHNCDPHGEHCAGHCPGRPGCERPAHQPPQPNGLDSVWRGQGRHRPWDTGGAGPLRTIQRLAVTGEDAPARVIFDGPSMAGPSR